MKKALAIFLAAALLAGSTAGCTSGGGNGMSNSSTSSLQAESSTGAASEPARNLGTAENPVTIKFVGNANSTAGFEARAAEFMAQNPNIKVEVQGVPANSWGDLMQAISINIAGGDIPDIADIASEGQRTFAASGLIVPLDNYIARDQAELKDTLDNIDSVLMDAMKYDGKTYCLPTVWNNMLLYYNKNVLREFNLEEPKAGWTIDDFLTMCQTVVSKNDGVNDKYGYAFANGYFVTLVPWMLVNGGNVLNDDWSASRLTDPDTIAGVQMLYDFVNKYHISPKLDAGVGDFDLFVQDKLAFMGAGMWQVNGLKNSEFPVEDYDVIPFPKGKADAELIGIGGAPIFAASEQKDAAWEFAKFLSGKEFQETFIVEDGWSIPSVRTAADILAQKPFAPKNSHFFYDSVNNGILVPAPQEYGTIEEVLLREFGAAMADMKTIPQAMADAEAEINAAIAKRGA